MQLGRPVTNQSCETCVTLLCQPSYQTQLVLNKWLWLARYKPTRREICLSVSHTCQSKWNMSLYIFQRSQAWGELQLNFLFGAFMLGETTVNLWRTDDLIYNETLSHNCKDNIYIKSFFSSFFLCLASSSLPHLSIHILKPYITRIKPGVSASDALIYWWVLLRVCEFYDWGRGPGTQGYVSDKVSLWLLVFLALFSLLAQLDLRELQGHMLMPLLT